MGRWIRRTIAVAATLAALAPVARADAAETIGEAYGSSGGISCSNDKTYIQRESAGNRYAVPFDGVVTSWTTGGFWSTATFKVARLGAGERFDVVAQDGPRSTSYNVEATYPVRIPVRQGDVIGAYVPAITTYCLYSGVPGDLAGESSGDVAPGPGLFGSSYAGYLPIAATIERDRDNDGFGDETQDGCPTSAATHGTCPLPTTIGQAIAPAPEGGCGGYTYIPVAPRDVRYTVPSDGILTSWSYSAGPTDATGTVRLKTMRPQEGDDYVAVGHDAARDPVAGLNSFLTRLAVRQGDRIALAVTGGLRCLSSVGSGTSLQHEGDPAIGAPAAFTERNRALSLSAVIEADADGDGFGDTTQDKCPTDSTTQGTCPVKPPTESKACKKAKAKLAKAKAKLAKLKKNDAAAKKVKKARKAVKAAKGKVKKAC